MHPGGLWQAWWWFPPVINQQPDQSRNPCPHQRNIVLGFSRVLRRKYGLTVEPCLARAAWRQCNAVMTFKGVRAGCYSIAKPVIQCCGADQEERRSCYTASHHSASRRLLVACFGFAKWSLAPPRHCRDLARTPLWKLAAGCGASLQNTGERL